MVVDDEKDVELLFRQRFRLELKEGLVELHFAFSGEEAVQYLSKREIADIVLILSDINMPGMSGFELLRILKGQFNQMKVLMITAYDDESNRKTATDFGADGFITKPIDFITLKQTIFSF